MPRRQRDRLTARRVSGRATLRRGGHPLRRPGPRRPGRSAFRLRPGRPLLAPGRVQLRRQRAGSGQVAQVNVVRDGRSLRGEGSPCRASPDEDPHGGVAGSVVLSDVSDETADLGIHMAPRNESAEPCVAVGLKTEHAVALLAEPLRSPLLHLVDLGLLSCDDLRCQLLQLRSLGRLLNLFRHIDG